MLPELTSEETKAIDSIPSDAVEHWAKGEIWDGDQWVADKVDCPYCHGTGKDVSGTRSYCKGTGKVDADDPLTGPGGA